MNRLRLQTPGAIVVLLVATGVFAGRGTVAAVGNASGAGTGTTVPSSQPGTPPGTQPATRPDASALAAQSASARAAKAKFDKDADEAAQELQRKVQQARQEYEKRLAAARAGYAGALKSAAADEAKKNHAEIAAAIHELVTTLEQVVVAHWPAQVLPEVESAALAMADPAPVIVPAALAAPEKTDHPKPRVATRVFVYGDEKTIREFWHIDGAEQWQIKNDGLVAAKGTLTSVISFAGDFDVALKIRINGTNGARTPVTLACCGETLPFAVGTKLYNGVVQVSRRKDLLFVAAENDKKYTIKIKQENLNVSTPFAINFKQSIEVLGCKIDGVVDAVP